MWQVYYTKQAQKDARKLASSGLKNKAQVPAGELAYAQQRALELGIAIAGGAEMVLLDEPVASMSHSEAENAV